VPQSQANFVWLPLGMRTLDFAEQASDARIVVRPYSTDGVRITIGAPAENDALLRFAQEWRAATR
jgi:histidinol-phosphate aminotransferase